jgi:hypothetical protein
VFRGNLCRAMHRHDPPKRSYVVQSGVPKVQIIAVVAHECRHFGLLLRNATAMITHGKIADCRGVNE